MNKHFDDSRYYLTRAAAHAKLGLSETFEPHTMRVRELLGRETESEPEPTRLEGVLADVSSHTERAKGHVRDVTVGARETVSQYREHDSSTER